MSRFLIAIAALFLTLSPAWAQTLYLRWMEDVPLPQSFREAGEPVVFEGAEGRIIQTSASGRGPAEAARRFYLEALPPLGWRSMAQAGETLNFSRGRDHLSIEVSDTVAATNDIRFRMVTGADSGAPIGSDRH